MDVRQGSGAIISRVSWSFIRRRSIRVKDVCVAGVGLSDILAFLEITRSFGAKRGWGPLAIAVWRVRSLAAIVYAPTGHIYYRGNQVCT
jgi:hypothetical protein